MENTETGQHPLFYKGICPTTRRLQVNTEIAALETSSIVTGAYVRHRKTGLLGHYALRLTPRAGEPAIQVMATTCNIVTADEWAIAHRPRQHRPLELSGIGLVVGREHLFDHARFNGHYNDIPHQVVAFALEEGAPIAVWADLSLHHYNADAQLARLRPPTPAAA